jgi:hypothetical protein
MRIVVGAMLGGILGFWFRPSVPLLGQLPLETVIARGGNLRGLDVILKGIAEQSFNYIVVGAILGAVVGLVLARITPSQEKKTC